MCDKIEALANRRLQWLNAIDDGDVDKIVYFLRDNFEITLPGNLKFRNRKIARRYLNHLFHEYRCEWLLSNVNRLMAVNCALEKGNYKLSLISGKLEESVRHYGDYFVLWRCSHGDKWRVELVCFVNRTSSCDDRTYYFSNSLKSS